MGVVSLPSQVSCKDHRGQNGEEVLLYGVLESSTLPKNPARTIIHCCVTFGKSLNLFEPQFQHL